MRWRLEDQLRFTCGEFPGSPVVRTQRVHCWGPGSIPGQGTKIPQAAWHGQKKKKIHLLWQHRLNIGGLVTNQLCMTDRNLEWHLSFCGLGVRNLTSKPMEEQVYGQYAKFNFGCVNVSYLWYTQIKCRHCVVVVYGGSEIEVWVRDLVGVISV